MKPIAGFTAAAVVAVLATSQVQAKDLVFSTSSLKDVNQSQIIQETFDRISEQTNGDLKFETHYGGTLFSQSETMNALERGLIQVTFTSFSWITSRVPEYRMFTAGYFFKNKDHMNAVLNGEIGKEIFEDIAAKTGIRILSAWYFGERNLNYRDIGHKIETPADTAGLKLRMPNSEAWLNLGRALGANPVPVALPEVYLALSTGTIDAQENPLPNTIQRKFYEVAKNITLTGHLVDQLFIAVNEDTWQSLTDDERAAITSNIEVARKEMEERTVADTDSAIEFLKSQGVTIIRPDLAPWIEHAAEYYGDSGLTADWDMSLYERVQAAAD